MDTRAFASKTLNPADLNDPAVRPRADQLRRFAWKLAIANVPFAVNGVLRRRFLVRPHKTWEYARGLACVLAKRDARASRRREPRAEGGRDRRKFRVLDFGGAATLPVFYLAQLGCEVWCLDVDPTLVNWTNQTAWKRNWTLRALTDDLTAAPAPPEWGRFDAVVSFSVLEHLARPAQAVAVQRLAGLVKPQGVLALTFDYGKDAPQPNALRNETEVHRLIAASGMKPMHGDFTDSGQRFALDKRHPRRLFTFASLFLKKSGE